MGVHPYRQWCNQTAHRDSGKCPIHIAAESSQLLILKLFITKNPLTLACQDPEGRDPLKVALQLGHSECVRYLANKLCSVVSLPNMSLPMRLYLQIKRWASLGQKRAASRRCQYTSTAFKPRVGDTLLVDGFNQPNMSSKSRRAVTKPSRGIKAKSLQPLPPISNSLSVSHLLSKLTPPQLPSLQSVNLGVFEEMQKRLNQDVKSREDGPLDEIGEEDSSLCRSKFVLPPITRGSVPKSLRSSYILEPFSHRTSRENAIYCLTMARSLCFVFYMLMCKKTHPLGSNKCHFI